MPFLNDELLSNLKSKLSDLEMKQTKIKQRQDTIGQYRTLFSNPYYRISNSIPYYPRNITYELIRAVVLNLFGKLPFLMYLKT